jgi:hypothetical protein
LFIDGSFDERATHELARSKGQQERGHVSGTASASEKFLIFLRNLSFAHESERVAIAVCQKIWARGVRQSGRSRRPAAA